MNDTTRTFGCAHAARHTFFPVDDCMEINHMDGIGRTIFFTDLAANAAGCAGLSCVCGFLLVRAQRLNGSLRCFQTDQMLRTCFYTESASDTLIPVNLSDPLLVDGESVQLARSFRRPDSHSCSCGSRPDTVPESGYSLSVMRQNRSPRFVLLRRSNERPQCFSFFSCEIPNSFYDHAAAAMLHRQPRDVNP